MSRVTLGTDLERQDELALDVDRLLVTRLLLQANSGAGKSWALRRLIEQVFGHVPLVVIDIDGEFFTLREKFAFVLASGGSGADCRVDVKTAPLFARRILEHGFSTIVDISEMKEHERKRFVRVFVEALMEAPRKLWRPLLIVVDEAHVFCPEKGQAESAGAIADLMTRGRKRGFCGVLATQRISKLNKDAAAEANNKLIGRAALDVDMKRAADELGFSTREQQLQLRALEEGQFYAFGPAFTRTRGVTRMKVGPVKTTHLEPGNRGAAAAPPLAPEKLKAMLSTLADLPKDAATEEGELERLRRENADLRRRNAEAGRAPAPADPAANERARQDGYAAGQAAAHAGAEQKILDVIGHAKGITDELGKVLAFEAGAAAKRLQAGPKAPPGPRTLAKPTAPPPRSSAPRPVRRASGEEHQVSGAQQRILDALAWLASIRPLDPANRTQLALLAGQSPTSSGYSNNLGALRTAGLIEYPTGGTVKLTDAGHAAAEQPTRAPTTEELHRTIQAKVTAPQWRIVSALIEAYPGHLSREDLADRAEQSASSSGYSNNLGALRSLGFIDYPQQGRVIARPELFLEDQ